MFDELTPTGGAPAEAAAEAAAEFEPKLYEQPAAAPAGTALVTRPAAGLQAAIDLASLQLPAEMLGDAQALALVLQQAAELGLDLADEEAFNESAPFVGVSVPRIIIQQRADDKHAELEIGLYTLNMPLEQFEEFGFVALASKFQRQYRPKYDPDKEEQDPTYCWSRDALKATGGTICDERHWAGQHSCGDSRKPGSACEYNKWRDGKKACEDAYVLLVARLIDVEAGRYEPAVLVGRKSSAGIFKAMQQQRQAYSYRFGAALPAQLGAFRPLTVGFSMSLKRIQERGKDYYVPVVSLPWETPKAHIPALASLAVANKKLFEEEIHVEFLVEEGDEEGNEEGNEEGAAATPPASGKQPAAPAQQPPSGQGSRPARW